MNTCMMLSESDSRAADFKGEQNIRGKKTLEITFDLDLTVQRTHSMACYAIH